MLTSEGRARMDWFTVTDILDVNTIAVWPPWSHEGKRGRIVRIDGLDVPARGPVHRDIARCKLRFLICGSTIKVVRISGLVSDEVLAGEVHYGGRNLVEHLHEYASPITESPSGHPAEVPNAAILFNL